MKKFFAKKAAAGRAYEIAPASPPSFSRAKKLYQTLVECSFFKCKIKLLLALLNLYSFFTSLFYYSNLSNYIHSCVHFDKTCLIFVYTFVYPIALVFFQFINLVLCKEMESPYF